MASLRLIQILGHGADGVLRSAGLIQERGIIVARANPGDITIAEFLLGNMIALSRRIVPMHVRLAHHGDWSEEIKARRGEGSLGGELYGSTLGLIGFGGIARELAVRADAMGMKVGLLSRQPERHKESGLEFVVDWREIDSFLGRCDYVVLALPLTEDTRGLIDAGRLQAMRRGAYLLNISRGALVDEDALCDALVDGHLAGAALDVFESEDRSGPRRYPLPRPVHDLNVILTPHYASGTVEARWRALRTVGENLRRMLSGEPLANVVDVAKGY
jgi:phosphoglycerate dehydrogenase-like enzyme